MTIEDSQRVRAVAQRIVDASSPEVQAEIDSLKQSAERPAWVDDSGRAMRARYGGFRVTRTDAGPVLEAPVAALPQVGSDETIVFAVGTPVFLVKSNAIDIDSGRAEAKAWKRMIAGSAKTLDRMMASIGRVEVVNFSQDFVGTAWVIDDGLVVTNRHVANLFAEASGAGFKFKLGFDARTEIGVGVDFLEEFGSQLSDEVKVEKVVWVAPEQGPDVAFLKLDQRASPVGRIKLELTTETPRPKLPVAVVGYPMSDQRFSDQALARKIFGDIFDKKRVAVGNLLGVGDDAITHSCSTLGGNSGSPVIDIGSGKVVGLHYRGVEFLENDAVSVSQLRRCLARARGLLETNMGQNMGTTGSDGNGSVAVGVPGSGGVTFTVPLKITVEIGDVGEQASIAAPFQAAATGALTGTPPTAPIASPTKEEVQAAVRTARTLLANREDVVAIKPGYRFENGEITEQRAVVIAVRRKVEKGALESRGVVPLPEYVDGVRTDVTVASTSDLLGVDAVTEAFAPSWHTSYVERPDLPLKRRKTKTRFIMHSSPDSGWPQLSDFFTKTRKSLVVAMYDVGAVNVVNGLLAAVKGKNETVSLVLQMGGKVHDEDFNDFEVVEKLRDAKGAKFDFAPASVGKTGIFDSAYHIKVAVRDNSAMWLSSGNWQISNQPDVAPLTNAADASALRLYNREWHVILEDPELSQLYEQHILRDMADARAVSESPPAPEQLVFVPADMEVDGLEAARKPRYFEPLSDNREIDVQPILTPDNYIDAVVGFIRSAKRTIYFQNQSFSTKTIGGRYRELLDALLAKQKEGVEVRIIFRSFGSDDRDVITNAKNFGFDTKWIRKQKNCHTKGIIIDGEAVLVGSHNWTTAGTNFNRDASLIFYDRDVARFFETLFLYDWERIGPAKLDESVPPPILVMPGNESPPPPGYVAVPLSVLQER